MESFKKELNEILFPTSHVQRFAGWLGTAVEVKITHANITLSQWFCSLEIQLCTSVSNSSPSTYLQTSVAVIAMTGSSLPKIINDNP